MRMERVAKILASIVVGLTVVSGIAGATVAGSLGSIRTDDVNSRLNNRPTKNPNPTDAEIRQGMASTLCRCMTYYRIQAAIKRAAGMPA